MSDLLCNADRIETWERGRVIEAIETARKGALAAEWHPYGFITIPVIRQPSKALLIHVWNTTFSPPFKPVPRIHSHNCLLKSRVLVGRLEHLKYRVTPGLAQEYSLYSVEYVRDQSRASQNPGCYAAELVESIELFPDQSYLMDKDEYHNTICVGFAATLALMWNHSEPPPTFLAEGTSPVDQMFDWPKLEDRSRDDILTRILIEYQSQV